MFNQKSNAACKNILFNQCVMHASMERLYDYLRTNKKVVGQSAVAVAMGETPQVLNNWEARGISQRGANLAQKKFGCDANWLLGAKPHPSTVTSTIGGQDPPKVQTTQAAWGWPFMTITVAQYSLLDDDQKTDIEKYVNLQIKTREPPKKLDQLANNGTKDKAA